MTFREQVEALTSTCTGGMVPAMRQSLVFLARRIEAAQPAAPTVEELRDALVDEGYPPELPMQLLRAVLQEADGLDPQWTQSYEERMGEPGQTLATLSSDLKHEQPTLHQQIGDLIEAAIKEDEELSGVSGGKGSSSGFMAKTWTRTPNATKKQKWEKRGLDVAEVFVAGALVTRLRNGVIESRTASQMIRCHEWKKGAVPMKPGETTNLDCHDYKGEFFKVKANKGRLYNSMDYEFATWGGRLRHEAKMWIPGVRESMERKMKSTISAKNLNGEQKPSKEVGQQSDRLTELRQRVVSELRPRAVSIVESDSDFDHVPKMLTPRAIEAEKPQDGEYREGSLYDIRFSQELDQSVVSARNSGNDRDGGNSRNTNNDEFRDTVHGAAEDRHLDISRPINPDEIHRASVDERRYSTKIESSMSDIHVDRPQRSHSQVIPSTDKVVRPADNSLFLSKTEFANSAERLGSFTSKAETELTQAAKGVKRNIERDIDEAVDRSKSTIRDFENDVEDIEDF
jgi:hypothetical protein